MDKSFKSQPDQEVLRALGQRLRALRRSRGLTAQEAALRAGLDRNTVHRAEAGRNPTLATLVRLLRVYGRLEALEEFLVTPEVSPMDLLRAARKARGDG